mgnify:CR=1 FL=1
MSDINKWIGSGRVTRDTELRYTPSGTAVVDVGLCCNRVWNKDGQRQEEATFVDVTLWGKQAETLSQYLTKGTFVIVEGRLILDAWETPEGVKRSKLRVVADRVNLGPKQSGKRESVPDLDDVPEEVQAPF